MVAPRRGSARTLAGKWLAALLVCAATGCAWSQTPPPCDCNYGTCSVCIGPPSASRSSMLVHNSTDCTATSGDLCTCKSCNLTGFPSGSPGVQCSPAGDADGRPISIDPRDGSGRKTAENGDTNKTSFVIAINRKDATDWNSHIIENRLVCTSPAINWAASSLTYDAAFKCNVAGRYEISSHPAIGPDTGDPIGTTTIMLVPQQADPSNTLAFLANQKAEWCTGASDQAPRCRTKKGQENQVLVVVRDRFGNPRPGTHAPGAAEAAKDYVTWSTKVNDTGKVINSNRSAAWNEQQLAYVAEFMFTEDFAFVFVLSLAVNGQPWQILPNKSPTSREVWQHNRPTDADGDPFSPLWSSTEFKWTG